jgi:DNA processing protein
MSTEVDEADRLARVTLSTIIEPGDLRGTGLVSELGARKVLGYLEAAGDVEAHWGFAIAQELDRVDPPTHLAPQRVSPGQAEPTSAAETRAT